MKWYHYLLAVLILLITFGAGWFSHFYPHSLACPLCIGKGVVIDPSYIAFWAKWALPFCVGMGIIVLCQLWQAISLQRIADK